MKWVEVVPAASVSLLVTGALVAAQLLPAGEGTVLVRVAPDEGVAALRAAAAADARLVAIPAPGFAVLYGDAARIRRTLGLAVAWKGQAPCTP
jgi:hypothetical protein